MTDQHDLDGILAVIAAAEGCIAEHQDAVRAARRRRDDGVRALAAKVGPAETARLTGMSLATVKAINRGR